MPRRQKRHLRGFLYQLTTKLSIEYIFFSPWVLSRPQVFDLLTWTKIHWVFTPMILKELKIVFISELSMVFVSKHKRMHQRLDKQFLSRSLDQSQQVLTTQSKNVFQVLREEMNSWKEANCTQSNQYPAVTFLTVAWLQKFFIFKHDKAKIKSVLNANQCFKLSNFFSNLLKSIQKLQGDWTGLE